MYTFYTKIPCTYPPTHCPNLQKICTKALYSYSRLKHKLTTESVPNYCFADTGVRAQKWWSGKPIERSHHCRKFRHPRGEGNHISFSCFNNTLLSTPFGISLCVAATYNFVLCTDIPWCVIQRILKVEDLRKRATVSQQRRRFSCGTMLNLNADRWEESRVITVVTHFSSVLDRE